jgi:hypothetical protein
MTLRYLPICPGTQGVTFDSQQQLSLQSADLKFQYKLTGR